MTPLRIEDLSTHIAPTTVRDTDGGWFAGIKHGLTVYYWRDNKFLSEDAAAHYAKCRIEFVVDFLKSDFSPMQQLGQEEGR